MKKRFAILLIVLIGLFTLSLSSCHKRVTHQETAANETEWMPDENLRWAVRRTLKLAPDASLTPQALERETQLHVDRQQIRSLKGLAYATGLKVLSLSENRVIDITSLANLMGLQKLYLSGSDISDLTPLANLTELQVLDLSDNGINDLTPLANLTELKELDLYNDKINDLTPLANLTRLQVLYLWGNPTQDGTPLQILLKNNPKMTIKE